MPFEIEKENTGIAFVNDKQTDKSPDYSGSVNVEGKQLRVAVWINENGNLGLVFSEHQEEKKSSGRASGGRKTYTKPTRR